MMQVPAINLSSATQMKEYKLKGGVTIHDKTEGIAKAVFSPELSLKSREPAYEIFIYKKKLALPIWSCPLLDRNVVFTGSKSIAFKQKDAFIKFIEVDSEGRRTVLYVDPKKPIEGKAYYVYSYFPREMELGEAIQKVKDLETNFPDFKSDIAIYNRHGVAVFGWNVKDQTLALYWASPCQKKLEKIPCSTFEQKRDGGTSIAKSEDGCVHFRYLFGKGQYLNGESATRITEF